jgi:hypothetical protein
LSARSAADQLGHAKPSLTAHIYMGRKKRATGAAEVLEDLFHLIGQIRPLPSEPQETHPGRAC